MVKNVERISKAVKEQLEILSKMEYVPSTTTHEKRLKELAEEILECVKA